MITDIITSILQQFYKKDINYAILRNYDNFNFEENKDIDLIIDPNKTNEIIKIIVTVLKKEGVQYQIKKHLRITRIHFEVDSNRRFAIDLNKYVTIKTSGLERRIPYLGTKLDIGDLKTLKIVAESNTFKLLDETHDLLLLTNHCFSKPKQKYIRRIKKGLADLKREDLIDNEIDLNEILIFFMNESNILKQSIINQLFQSPKFIYNYLLEK